MNEGTDWKEPAWNNKNENLKYSRKVDWVRILENCGGRRLIKLLYWSQNWNIIILMFNTEGAELDKQGNANKRVKQNVERNSTKELQLKDLFNDQRGINWTIKDLTNIINPKIIKKNQNKTK